MTHLPPRLIPSLAALVLLLAGPAASESEARCPQPDGPVDLVVAMREAPPFIVEDTIRGQRGFAFDVWASVEKELRAAGLVGSSALVTCPLGAQLAGLADGSVDVVISPLTITSDRLASFDFSHQYLSSGTTVAQRASSAINFRYAADILRQTLGHPSVQVAIAVFLAANLLLAGLMSWALRQHSDFSEISREPRPVRMLRYGVEAVIRTIGLRGLGDGLRATSTTMLEIFMAVVGTILSATIFGMLTSALVGSIGGSRTVTLAELPVLRVATLAQSTSAQFLDGLARQAAAEEGTPRTLKLSLARRKADSAPALDGASGAGAGHCLPPEAASATDLCLAMPSWEAAMNALAAGQVDAVFGDWAQLSYLARLPAYSDALTVQDTAFWNEPYGWGLSRDLAPEIRTAIDRALIRRLRSPEWRVLVQEYMGDGAISPN